MISVCYCIFQWRKVVVYALPSDATLLVAVSQGDGSVIHMMIVVTTLMSRIVVSKYKVNYFDFHSWIFVIVLQVKTDKRFGLFIPQSTFWRCSCIITVRNLYSSKLSFLDIWVSFIGIKNIRGTITPNTCRSILSKFLWEALVSRHAQGAKKSCYLLLELAAYMNGSHKVAMGDVRVMWPVMGTCPTTNKHWKCKKTVS